MEHDETLFQIEVMPKIEGFWCKTLVLVVYLAIVLTPFAMGAFFWWYLHSLWIGFSFILFGMLASGVVISKMRINSIPFEQREMNYSTFAVVKWYIGKNKCI